MYIQLNDADVIDPQTGRVDKDKMGPEKLLQVAQRSFHPYKMDTKAFDWWTIYISKLPLLSLVHFGLISCIQVGQRVAAKFSVNERVFIAGDACHTHSPKAGRSRVTCEMDVCSLTSIQAKA